MVTSSSSLADLYSEYSTFLHPTFDPNTFAHSIINNAPYPLPTATTSSHPHNNNTTEKSSGESDQMIKSNSLGGSFFLNGSSSNSSGGNGNGNSGDVSAALIRLNFGVEDLTRQLKGEITKHHSALLFQAASLGGLDGDLNAVRRGLVEVESGVTKLRKKITVPHSSLSTSLALLTRLRRASSLTRRASRFTVLARRLEGQMNEIDGTGLVEGNNSLSSSIGPGGERTTAEKRERAMAEAALTLAEIQILLSSYDENPALDDPEALLSIRSIKAVEMCVPAVESSRQRVVEEMESTVQRGLDHLDNPLLASSLQTAHNLSVLPTLVESLVLDLTQSVTQKIKACFDISALARELNGKETASSASAFVYKSRARNEPTNVTMPQWTSTMWSRIDSLINDLGDICIRIYALEKVLKLKKDSNTQASFLDEAMTLLDNKPSLMFWTSVSQAFEIHTKETARSSLFIQTIFSTGYPRLLRLIHAFFLRITVHTDTIYTHAQQSPETIILLRSILPFETLYLTRSSNRLNEAVASSYSVSSSLSSSFTSRPPTAPTANEGLATARAIVNELDASRFDPLLVKSIAKGAARAVESYIAKATVLVAHDNSSISLMGPLATPSQHTNADLASSLYHLWVPLSRASNDHSEVVREILKPSIEGTRSTYLSIINPLIMAIRREFSAIITRMHRVDYSKKVDPNSNPMMNSSASAYMVDLIDKLTLVRDEVLGGFRVGELAKEWALELAKFTVQTFVLHASIVKPLGESGKLKLTSDTTSLEFAISQYLSAHALTLSSMGDQFKALRAFRPLLFLDNNQLALPKYTSDVPTLILLHHVLSRSSIPLPHQVHNWSEAEYVRWLNEHGEKDRIKIVEEVLKKWEEKKSKSEGEVVDKEADEFVITLRTILSRD